MALFEMVMPQMGESVMEGTIIKWLKNIGDFVKQDESVLEVATDKVDTEIPTTFSGYVHQFLVREGDVVQIGKPIAIFSSEKIDANSTVQTTDVQTVETQETVNEATNNKIKEDIELKEEIKAEILKVEEKIDALTNNVATATDQQTYGRFYSPLVLNIAKEEKITFAELEKIIGTGLEGRVTKNDILSYIKDKPSTPVATVVETKTDKIESSPSASIQETVSVKPAVSISGNTEIIQMDRMRKMIAERMLESQRVSATVTSFVEADVTNLISWKNKMKHEFKNRENDTLTLTPLFIEAIARAVKDYPLINASVEGDTIVVKKYVNVGMAVALPSGNLIVPVIKNVDQLNIVGITKKVNELARKARENKLTADDLSDGTYTMSNVGQFGNVMGTPVIVQPQIAIMAFGTAVKKPAVIETPNGDAIGIRHMMFLSHSYDHRVVDGALGGMFVRRVADYLEHFDINRKIW
jgi:2-oxoglutarate dehydrogenase E2 component (dihydrolipoamide succinyltransferase)